MIVEATAPRGGDVRDRAARVVLKAETEEEQEALAWLIEYDIVALYNGAGVPLRDQEAEGCIEVNEIQPTSDTRMVSYRARR